MCMQDPIEGITDPLDIRIMRLIDITPDVPMPDWARCTETTIPIEGKISIETIEELPLGTTPLEEAIMAEAMPQFPTMLRVEETQR